MKVTSPYFLQAASARKSGGNKIVLRLSKDVTDFALGQFGGECDVQVTTTYQGATTTVDYQGVETVLVNADKNTNIVVKGEIPVGYLGSYNDPESVVYLELDCKGWISLQAVSYGNLVLKNTLDLQQVLISANVASFDFSRLGNVSFLICAWPIVTSLDLSPMQKLEHAQLVIPSVSELNLDGLTQLKTLIIQGSSLEELDLSALTGLTGVNVDTSHMLKSLVLPESNLETLDITDCELLPAPDISVYPGLTRLSFENILFTQETVVLSGMISSLAIEGSSVLKRLDVTGLPALRSIYVEGDTALEELLAGTNSGLQDVHLQGNSALRVLDVGASDQLFMLGNNMGEPFPFLSVIKVRCEKYGLSSSVRDILENPETPSSGTIYLDSADEYYSVVANAAANKGWTIQSLT